MSFLDRIKKLLNIGKQESRVDPNPLRMSDNAPVMNPVPDDYKEKYESLLGVLKTTKNQVTDLTNELREAKTTITNLKKPAEAMAPKVPSESVADKLVVGEALPATNPAYDANVVPGTNMVRVMDSRTGKVYFISRDAYNGLNFSAANSQQKLETIAEFSLDSRGAVLKGRVTVDTLLIGYLPYVEKYGEIPQYPTTKTRLDALLAAGKIP